MYKVELCNKRPSVYIQVPSAEVMLIATLEFRILYTHKSFSSDATLLWSQSYLNSNQLLLKKGEPRLKNQFNTSEK